VVEGWRPWAYEERLRDPRLAAFWHTLTPSLARWDADHAHPTLAEFDRQIASR